jgi:hypothetical protein
LSLLLLVKIHHCGERLAEIGEREQASYVAVELLILAVLLTCF